MAKKIIVNYAFGTPTGYENLKQNGLIDDYTLYFIASPDATEATIYKGLISVGTTEASKLIFDTSVNCIIQGEEPELIYTIQKGTKLTDAISSSYMSLFYKIISEKDETLAYIDQNYMTKTDGNTLAYDMMQDTSTKLTNYYTKQQADASFLSKSELGQIQELAEIFSDASLVQTIIDAANGIEGILNDYYNKDYIDQLALNIDNVKTFDSSLTFPIEGEKNILYIDDLENKMYRYALPEDSSLREYTLISGSGGSSNVQIETNIYMKDGKTTFAIAKGTSFNFNFAFSSAYTYIEYDSHTGQFNKVKQETGNKAYAKYYIDGILFDSGIIDQAPYNENDDTLNIYNNYTIPSSKFNSSIHRIKIVISDISNNETSEEFTISIISATITSSYVPTVTSLDKFIEIPVTVSASGSADVYYKVDNDASAKFSTLSSGSGLVKIEIEPVDSSGNIRIHGEHDIKVWATTYITESSTTIFTSILNYKVIWYDENNNTPIISSFISNILDNNNIFNITQYEYITLAYQVYPSSNVELIIEDASNNINIINTLNVDTKQKNWIYTYEKYGSFKMYLRILYDESNNLYIYSKKYDIIVAQSQYTLEPTEGAVVYFSAKNRSNDEENPNHWESEIGLYDASLLGFSWNNNSGWYTSNNTTALRVGGNASCIIPFYPFNSDYRDAGQTIEFDFSTTNLSDSTTTVISCYSESDKSGIIINANNAYFISSLFNIVGASDSRIYVPFKENERIRLSFTISPKLADPEGHGPNDPEAIVSVWNTELQQYENKNSINLGWYRFVSIYINGICVSRNLYGESSFKQNVPSYIKVGSTKAIVDLYSIRAYNKILYDNSVVNNYIADTQNAALKINLFKRNNILNTQNTEIDYSKLLTKIPCMFITCESDSTYKGFTNNDHVLPTYKGDKRGCTVLFNTELLEDKTYYDFCTSFLAKNAQIDVQGTSSQYYPRKNWKIKFATKSYNPDYNAQVQTKNPTYLYLNTTTADASLYNKNYKLRVYPTEIANTNLNTINSQSTTYFCLKADFAESSGTHNTGMAKFVDYFMKMQGPSFLTPPQLAQYNASNRIGTDKMIDINIRTTIDGYPIALFWRRTSNDNYSFYGKFNFNHDKGAENIFGFIDSVESLINPYTGVNFTSFNKDYYDNASDTDRLNYIPPIECWEFTNNTTDISKFKNVTDKTFTDKTYSSDAGKDVYDWMNSFESRHPDDDTLTKDYTYNGKSAVHFAKFCKWVSSTDRNGYLDPDNKLYPIGTAWNGTYNELIAGAANQETFITIQSTLDTMNINPLSYNTLYRYILQPIDNYGDPNTSYSLYGHIAGYNTNTLLWEDNGEYIQENTNVDYNTTYYINNNSDLNYKNVYQYDSSAKIWNNVGNLESHYLLSQSVIYNAVTYLYDTAEYRLAKFKAELNNHMNINIALAYYILTEFVAAVDQRAKNMMLASWGYESHVDASSNGAIPIYKYNKLNTEDDTILYYVSPSANYMYYPIFYDNDTILSLNNTGYIKFNPNVESTDKVGTGYAYNGTESVLWLNVKDAFVSEIASMYADMRTKALTYDKLQEFFTEEQSDQWAENLYNIDGKFKYIDPATKGYIDYSQTDNNGILGVNIQEQGYLYQQQGPRKEHRKWWLNNRFSYMDSRYNTGTYKTSYATMRLYTPSSYSTVIPNATFNITPYADMYIRIKFGSVDVYTRAEKNNIYQVIPPDMRFNDTETIIYGAPYILSFGELSNKYAGSVAIGNASKISELLLGYQSPYYNENLTNLSVSSSNAILKKIDVRGCTKLTTISGLSDLLSLETFLATNTSLSEIDFSHNGANLTTIAYPSALATLKLINLNKITNNSLTIPSYNNIINLWLENCPNLESWNIVNNILGTNTNILKNVRITNINWIINTTISYTRWNILLSKSGISDTGSYNMNIPYLSGIVNIGQLTSTGYKANVEKIFADAGCDLTINTTNTSGLTGISITGDEVIAPNIWYKYSINYLPDNYIISAEKGVNWNIDPVFTSRNITASTIELMYEGSTSGTSSYLINATSIYNTSYTTNKYIRPSATLSSIKLFDTNGNEIDYDNGIAINEGDNYTLNVGFIPVNSPDSSLIFEVTGTNYLTYEYDPTSKSLTITGKNVTKQEVAYITVRSAIITTIYTTAKFLINNVVSRIFYIQDEIGNRIQGYINIKYYDNSTHQIEETQEFSSISNPGIISLPTNSKYGFGELEINVHATNENVLYYNVPSVIIAPEIPTSTNTDIVYTTTFYTPVDASIYIKNGNVLVTDRPLKIYSAENAALRGLINAPYNNVLSGSNNNPSLIKLLANTTHNIKIGEYNAQTGDFITSGGRYSLYSGRISSGTSDGTYEISISRDYLGNYTDYDDTELHMTILTGSGNYTVARIFLRTTGSIIINWGDESEQSNDAHLTIIGSAVTTETPYYHIYKSTNREYDIQVVENTGRIKWFHVIKETDTKMLPCIGTTSASSGFNTVWGGSDTGGLIAYQSIGGALINTMLRFNFDNKIYSKLLCIGNIYKSCIDAISAESLMENTTIEQIPSDKSLFTNNINIKTFKRTFKNSNITALSPNFFLTNTKATNFEETFYGCAFLSSIVTAEDVDFIIQDKGVEVESLKNMFFNCTTLTSEVPGLWKIYYGCSFAMNTSQNTYAGCTKVYNFANIPASWGGSINTPEYLEHSYKSLEYFYAGSNNTNEGYFEFTDIYPKGTWKYVYEFTSIDNPYEIVPLFGCASGTDINNITGVLDFSRGGMNNGSVNNPGIYTGVLSYRQGGLANSNWYTAKDNYGVSALVFDTSYGAANSRAIIDICHTTNNKIKIWPVDSSSNYKTFNLNNWDASSNYESTLPLLLLEIYNTNNMNAVYTSGYNPPYRGKKTKIHNLKIYDNLNNLIHDISPVYGKVEESMGAFLYDSITGNTYPYSGPVSDVLNYYKKY